MNANELQHKLEPLIVGVNAALETAQGVLDQAVSECGIRKGSIVRMSTGEAFIVSGWQLQRIGHDTYFPFCHLVLTRIFKDGTLDKSNPQPFELFSLIDRADVVFENGV